MQNNYSIASLADSLANDTGNFGTNKHLQYAKWALELYRQLDFSVLKVVKTVALPLNSYNALDYPADMVDWAKVGIQYGDKVYVLGTADDIALYHEKDDCGVPIKNIHHPSMDEVVNGLNVDNYSQYSFQNWQYPNFPTPEFQDNSFYGYGTGIPYKGFFIENREKRQLQFSSNVNAKAIYLEYITDGSCNNVDTVIPPLAYEYLRQAVHCRASERNPNVSQAQKDRDERLMEEARHNMVLLLSGINLKDIINHVRKGISLAPHY